MKLIKIKPHITEKSLKKAKNAGQYTFLVSPKATKPQISRTINQLFKVDTVKITTSIIKSTKHRSGRTGRIINTKPIKKATVTLKAKQSIKLFETKK